MKIIAKEELANFRYPKREVLSDPVEVNIRNIDLERAMQLGNLEHGKVKITFLDQYHNHFQVATTIWVVKEDVVCLKGYLFIHNV